MRTELAAQHSAPIPYGSTLWHCPHLILHRSHRLVLRWSHWWVDLLDSKPRHWDLPSGIELYPPSLGSTLHCWALPLVLVCPPPRLCRWALPSAVPSSLASAFRRWVITFVVGPCHCGICYAGVVVRPSEKGHPALAVFRCSSCSRTSWDVSGCPRTAKASKDSQS